MSTQKFPRKCGATTTKIKFSFNKVENFTVLMILTFGWWWFHQNNIAKESVVQLGT